VHIVIIIWLLRVLAPGSEKFVCRTLLHDLFAPWNFHSVGTFICRAEVLQNYHSFKYPFNFQSYETCAPVGFHAWAVLGYAACCIVLKW